MLRSLLVLLLAITALADQPIAPPRFGSSPEYQFSWALATNGENYFLTWSSHVRTHFATIDESGDVIDDAAIDSMADVLDAAAVGRDYLVLQRNEDSTGILRVDASTLAVKSAHTSSLIGNSLLASNGRSALLANGLGYAQTLDADGDHIGIDINFAHRAVDALAIASAANDYLIVWIAAGNLMRSAIADGVASPATLIASLDPTIRAFGRGSVASDGDGFLVAWRSNSDIRVVALAHDGTPLGEPSTIAKYDYTDAPQLTWNGREYVMVLETRDNNPGADVVSIHLDTHGRVIGPPQFVASGPPLQFRPALASTKRSTFAGWGEFASCYPAGYGGIVGRTIEPLGATSILSRSNAVDESPAAIGSRTQTLVAWTERSALRHVRASLLPLGKIIDIPATTYAQDSPAIATDGESFLLVWPELRDGDCATSISAVVVSPDGSLGPVTKLADDALTTARPAVTWNGSEYVVVWERGFVTQLLAVRVSRDGKPLNPQPIAITMPYDSQPFYSKRTGFPAIAWTGSEYLATWSYVVTAYIPFYPDPPPILELHTRRFSRELVAIGAESVIATPAYLSTMAWSGSEALVLFSGYPAVHVVRLRADGSVIAKNDLFDDTTSSVATLSLAWNGSEWIGTYGPQLIHIRADGTLRTRENLGHDVDASAVAVSGGATIVAYRRSDAHNSQVYIRSPAPPRRRAAQ